MASPNEPRAPSLYNLPREAQRRRYSAIEINPQVDALARKLIKDVETAGSSIEMPTENGRVSVPDPAYLRQISSTIAQDATDATSLMQLLPDINLLEQLLISSIMAPKDLTNPELNFSVDRRAFSLPIAGQMLEKVIDYFTNVYDLKKMCPEILSDIIFKVGSYALMVLPENSVDALINGTRAYGMESYNTCIAPLMEGKQYRSLHILGNGSISADGKKATVGQSFGMESFGQAYHTAPAYDPYVRALGSEWAQTVIVSDNFNALKVSAVNEAKREAHLQRALHNVNSFGLEMGNGNYSLGGVQRRSVLGRGSIVQAIKTKEMLQRPMVGHPLIMHLPSEAVIPVFISPEKHLGYFVLLDAEGHPIALANRRDIYNDLATQTNGAGSSLQGSSQMIQMAQNLSLGVNPQGPTDPRQMAKIYGQLLEHDLRSRLAAGIYGPDVNLRLSEDVYAIMMARSFKRQQTQIIYVPAALMSYMAFDYDERGFGRSMTERGKIIGSMRAMLMFSQLMGAIKNSVARQRVTLTLSDNDIDPSKTLARVMDEYTRRRNVTMPFVASDPADMISYLNMAGVEWNVEGKGAPAHKVDIEDKQSNRTQVNAELDKMLQDRHYQNYGLTPETVLASSGADFAATVVTNNQLFAKRVIVIQDKFTPHLEDFVHKTARNSAVLLNQLREVVEAALESIAKSQRDQNEEDANVVDQSAVNASQGASGQDLTQTAKSTKVADLPTYQTTGLPPPIVRDKGDSETTKVAPAVEPHEREHLINTIIEDFISAVEVKLPRPDTATVQAQTQALEAYEAAVDKKLSYIIDSTFMSDPNLATYGAHVDEIKANYKAHYMRQWMRTNGFLPELEEITAVDEDGKPEMDLLQSITTHANCVAAGIQGYLDKIGQLKETIKEGQAVLDQRYPDANLENGAMGGGGGTGGSEFGGGFGGEEPGAGMGGPEGGIGGEPGGEPGLTGEPSLDADLIPGENEGAQAPAPGNEEEAEETPTLIPEEEEEDEESATGGPGATPRL